MTGLFGVSTDSTRRCFMSCSGIFQLRYVIYVFRDKVAVIIVVYPVE